VVCLTTAWQTLASQSLFSTPKPAKQRWQTILANNPLGGIDTLIQGPRREFVTIVSNKLVADQNTRLAVLAIASLNKQVHSLEAEASVLDNALQSSLKVSFLASGSVVHPIQTPLAPSFRSLVFRLYSSVR